MLLESCLPVKHDYTGSHGSKVSRMGAVSRSPPPQLSSTFLMWRTSHKNFSKAYNVVG